MTETLQPVIALVHAGEEAKQVPSTVNNCKVIDLPVSGIIFYNRVEALLKEKENEQSPAFIIFTSANAVRALMHSCPDEGMLWWLKSIPVIAVGNKTRNAAEKMGFTVTAVGNEHNQEGIISFFQGMVHHSRKVMFPRSELAQSLLANSLSELGYTVIQPIVYTTQVLPFESFAPYLHQIHNNPPSIYLFTSPSSFTYFKELAGEELLTVPIAAIGKTTSFAIQRSGYEVLFTAEKQDILLFVEEATKKISEQ